MSLRSDALMSSLRIRPPFATSFAVLLLLSAYLSLAERKIPEYGQTDKGLHFITFFALTTTFYWILETSRRRCIHLTLLIVTAGLAIGSEIVQALLPNGRDFDAFDILANVVGSTCALLLSSWYHKRMLERRRKNKHYDIVPGEEGDEGQQAELDDLGRSERGEAGLVAQETGIVPVEQANSGATVPTKVDVSKELDNWDENDEDWEEEGAEAAKVIAEIGARDEDTKKRVD